MEPVNVVDSGDSDHDARTDTRSQVQSTGTTEISSKSSKRKASIWDEFEIINEENGKERAKCKFCPKSFAIGSSTHGTSNLRRHVEGVGKCLGRTNKDVNQMHIAYEASLRTKRINQETYREKMAIAIMKHNYPFLMVEHEGTRDVHKYLNPDVKPYTRNTAKADCMKIYKKEKEKLKLELGEVSGRICLTSDVWSSITSEGYISLTAHYVDDSWTLQSKVLNFSHFPPPHNGVFLADKLFQFLKEWGIENKIFSLTLDNASSNDNMQNILKKQICLQNSLLCGGEFFHVRCSAHILNLIVQDGLKVCTEALYKVRESVKFIKGSEGRLIKFAECCEHVGMQNSNGLRLDVCTRWNSTFLMLENAIKFRNALERYALVEPGYKYCPSFDEWKRGEEVCKLLAPFNEITNLFSGSKYPTANLYLRCVWKIQIRLLEEQESEDEVISCMAREMILKFAKYWDSYSIVLAMAAVLDPRYKMNVVEFCYKKIDESTHKEKVARVNEALTSLFSEYVTKFASHAPENHPVPTRGSIVDDDFMEFDFYESEIITTKKSELDLYLEETKYDHKQELNILVYWRDNKGRYPILSMMARDLMSIPITSVASESAFSIGAKVLSKYRSSLRPDTAECVICTRNWSYGFHVESDEPNDDQLIVPIPKLVTTSKESAT